MLKFGGKNRLDCNGIWMVIGDGGMGELNEELRLDREMAILIKRVLELQAVL